MKAYTCICGFSTDNSHLIGGHKQACETFIISKYGSVEKYYEIKNRNHWQGSQKLHDAFLTKKALELESWISEQHKCERCGKIMTEKFSTGRFCSRSCANARVHSETTKQKIGDSVKKYSDENHSKHLARIHQYEENPNRCQACGKILDYEHRNNKSCCWECKLRIQSQTMVSVTSENGLHCTAIKNYKFGFYHGIECDSSWELAYVVYHLDHDIKIERNKQGFTYVYNNSEHKYFPDFIVNGDYIEIKSYYNDRVIAKITQFPQDKKLQVVDKSTINMYLDYATEHYGIEFWKIYDIDRPSCNDTLKQ